MNGPIEIISTTFSATWTDGCASGNGEWTAVRPKLFTLNPVAN